MSVAGKRGTINLTALGSAAVIAVYAAGYMRTRAAARRFDGSDSDRRPAPPSAPALVNPLEQEPIAGADSPQPVSTPAKVIVVAAPKKPKPTPAKDSTQGGLPNPQRDSMPAPVPAPTPAPVAPPAAATLVDSAKATTDTLKALKDGTYTGWGTSRHGDIEAAVKIEGGRIVSAYITQCLTRYSCNRIAAIIPQVVARQSPEVDYVSGATQSTNAFYYAIVEALSKAK